MQLSATHFLFIPELPEFLIRIHSFSHPYLEENSSYFLCFSLKVHRMETTKNTVGILWKEVVPGAQIFFLVFSNTRSAVILLKYIVYSN